MICGLKDEKEVMGKISENIRYGANYIFDKYEKNFKLRIVIFIVLLIIFFVNIYILNQHTTYVADDYGFYLTAHAFHSLRDYIDVIYKFYFNWSGRIIPTAITYALLLLPIKIFHIINAIGYILLVLLVYFNIVGKREIYVSVLIFINFFFFAFLPAFGQDILWITGSGNYLWPTLVALFYSLLWRCCSPKHDKIYNNVFFAVFSGLCGFMAGMTNENTSIALFVMSIVFIFYYKRFYSKIYRFSLCAVIGELIGTVFLLLAPGNFERASHFAPIGIMRVLGNLRHNFGQIFNFDCLLVPLLIFCIFCIALSNKDKIMAYIFALTSMVAVVSLSLSPTHFEGRVVLSGLSYMMIAAGIMYIKVDFTNYKMKRIVGILSVFFVLGNFSLYKSAENDISDYQHDYNMNLDIIGNSIALGKKDVIVNKIYPKSRFCPSYGLEEIQTDSKHGVNVSAAKYFNVDTIQVVHVENTDKI